MQDAPQPSDLFYFSPVLGLAVTLGNLCVWLGLVGAITCVALYWTGMLRAMGRDCRARDLFVPAGIAAALVVGWHWTNALWLQPGPGRLASNLIVLGGLTVVAVATVLWVRRRPALGLVAKTASGASLLPAANGNRNGKAQERNGKRNGRADHGRARELATAADPAAGVLTAARRAFWFTAICAVVGSLALYTLIFGQHYAVSYIAKNSNPELPFGYRFASFWADQEGTFFLWSLYNVVLGGVLLWRARAEERWVMPFFGIVQISLFTLLTFMNPFWLQGTEGLVDELRRLNAPESFFAAIPNTFGEHLAWYFGWGQYVQGKWINTRGLNESLQNFWMVIHPPTLFVGFSSMMIPAAFALGALMKREYDTWIHRAGSWLLFSWTVLGFGIFLGGYWAYETLGWGGYWSWDPVENSSLLPWLGGTALLHGLLAQRNRGNLKHANLYLGVMCGALVLLSSFLNRSGVLEGSRHSFASPQDGVKATLTAVLALWFLLGTAVFIWRFRSIQSEIAYENVWERHFGFFLGLIGLCSITLVVAFGVTSPIWTKWLQMKMNVEHTFYNRTILPVIFLLLVLMALTPLMPWRRSAGGPDGPGRPRPFKPFTIAIMLLAGLISLFFIGAAAWALSGRFVTRNDPAYIAVGLMCVVALAANLVCLARSVRGGLTHAGPWLAHVGFVIMLGGILITTRFKGTYDLSNLTRDDAVTVLGRTFRFAGERKAANPADRDRVLIDVTYPEGKTLHLAPKVFVTQQSGEPQVMAWPVIVNEWFGGLWGDLYVEPVSTVGPGGVALLKSATVGTGIPVTATVQRKRSDPVDTVMLTVLDWKAPMQGHGPTVAPSEMTASVVLNVNGEEQRHHTRLRINGGELDPVPIPLSGLRQSCPYELWMTRISANDGTADFALVPTDPEPTVSIQVLHIPGIHVLWWGCYIMFAGGFLCYLRRRKLADRPAGGGARAALLAIPAAPKEERTTELEQPAATRG